MTLLSDQLDFDSRSFVDTLIDEGRWLDFVRGFTEAEWRALQFDWKLWRRPSQVPPGSLGISHSVWNVRAGRGFGKTRTGAETTREVVEWAPLIAIVAPTAPDVRDVMVEGETGILSVFPRHERPDYEPSKRRITFRNGARATTFSADEPERLRGPQYYWGWFDEPASMRRGKEAWDNFEFGLRLGRHPWALLTGTPKPIKWLRDLAAEDGTVTTTGSTYENFANLSDVFLARVLGKYEGTTIGRQELHAEWLDDVEGALWVQSVIDLHRVGQPGVPSFDRQRGDKCVVGVDPPGETAECGIITVIGPARPAEGGHVHVIDDSTVSGRPEHWGAQVVAAWKRLDADVVLVENNQGGDMCRAVIHAVDARCPVKKIRASLSKADRAEPVAALYERGRVHHVGEFPLLEAQMVTWVPDESKSPDRLDALVHAVNHLLPPIRPVQATTSRLAHRRMASRSTP